MKTVIRYIIFSLFLTLFLAPDSSIFADISIPVVKSVWIETRQSYTDYDLYIASFNRSATYNRGRIWTTHYDTLKLTPFSLVVQKAYEVAAYDHRNEYSSDVMLYLIAVNKNAGLEGTDSFKDEVIALAKGQDSKVFGKLINVQDPNGNIEKVSDRSRIYTIEKLDDKGMEVSDRYGQPAASGKPGTAIFGQDSIKLNIGLGLLLTSLITLVGLLLIKRR